MLPFPVLVTCIRKGSHTNTYDRTHHLTVCDGLRTILNDVAKVGKLSGKGARSVSDAAAHVYHQASFGECLPRETYHKRG
jgi:hypothetical protein